MKIIDLMQGTDEWLEWRKSGVTATDSTVTLGLSPYKTYWRLWAEKTGFAKPEDLSNNPNVQRGVKNEDKARLLLEDARDEILLPLCIQSEHYPIIIASLDGMDSKGVPVEIKCPSRKIWDDVCQNGVNSNGFKTYYPQVQHQMLAADAVEGWLAFYFEGQIKEFLVKPDKVMQTDIIFKAEIFYKEVVERKEPKKDPIRDVLIPTGDDAKTWISIADQYRFFDTRVQDLKKQIKELEAKKKPFAEQMKALMGDFYHADYAGVRVTRYLQAGSLDIDKMLADNSINIDSKKLEAYKTEAKDRYRITSTESLIPKNIVDEDVLAPIIALPEETESSWF